MLNINEYEIVAKYTPTKRKRKVNVKGRSERDAISKLGENYTDIQSVTFVSRPPTDRQVSYATSLGFDITEDMCFEDVSCLISSVAESDNQPPKQGLIDFADAHNIVFSNYAGKKRLYNNIFHQLSQYDAIAFFIFSLYRYLSDDRESNLDKSCYRNYFYDFADTYIEEEKFLKSLYENYTGEDLRFFGTLKVNDDNDEHCYYGGSTQTYAFQCAKKYLIDNGLISADVKNSKTLYTNRNSAGAVPEIQSTQVYQSTVNLAVPSVEDAPIPNVDLSTEIPATTEEPKKQKGCLFYFGILLLLYALSKLLL